MIQGMNIQHLIQLLIELPEELKKESIQNGYILTNNHYYNLMPIISEAHENQYKAKTIRETRGGRIYYANSNNSDSYGKKASDNDNKH